MHKNIHLKKQREMDDNINGFLKNHIEGTGKDRI
jgi:hypothetical protein